MLIPQLPKDCSAKPVHSLFFSAQSYDRREDAPFMASSIRSSFHTSCPQVNRPENVFHVLDAYDSLPKCLGKDKGMALLVNPACKKFSDISLNIHEMPHRFRGTKAE